MNAYTGLKLNVERCLDALLQFDGYLVVIAKTFITRFTTRVGQAINLPLYIASQT
jgi:hypothetical protein